MENNAFYSFYLSEETPESKHQLKAGSFHRNDEGKIVPINPTRPTYKSIGHLVDDLFRHKLFWHHIDIVAIEEMLDYHYHKYSGDKKAFLKHTKILVKASLDWFRNPEDDILGMREFRIAQAGAIDVIVSEWIQEKEKIKISRLSTSPEPKLIALNIHKIEQQKTIIKLIHSSLTPKCFNVTYKEFERHFIDNQEKLEQIKWLGTEPQLKSLFKFLEDEGLIQDDHVNELICSHFYNKRGKPFNAKQLSVVCSKTTYEFDNLKVIPSLTKEIKKVSTNF
ncbi:hypothetical protein Q0590_08515 [Rhodocytophaga aerolata]|uniref:Uncharacterized protein n=1 Tax=Rhodocytophaga aerolata TaxID=455078 RepID=A0ABT8R6B2_9BACT|nr:hypothetical protein [Rhodocytophaga aerolata]MDO1446292.1 hypothetical protein [Rhodocytophaga aerolata]